MDRKTQEFVRRRRMIRALRRVEMVLLGLVVCAVGLLALAPSWLGAGLRWWLLAPMLGWMVLVPVESVWSQAVFRCPHCGQRLTMPNYKARANVKQISCGHCHVALPD